MVSTPITDVAEPYGEIVYLGGTPEEFIAGCERVMDAGPQERAERQMKMAQVLKKTSWQATANRMHDVIVEVAEANRQKKQAGRERVLTAGGEIGASESSWSMRPSPGIGD
jgi:hypothetical protein